MNWTVRPESLWDIARCIWDLYSWGASRGQIGHMSQMTPTPLLGSQDCQDTCRLQVQAAPGEKLADYMTGLGGTSAEN